MAKLESSAHQPDSAPASASDVIGEFASSAWKAGVVRPLVGVAQLADPKVHMEPDRELHGAMKCANAAGHAAGTLADIVLLSRYVGKGVGAVGEKAGITSLTESGLTKSLTVSGATGFTDGFAFNPQQPGDGLRNRFAQGVAEGAGFMALDGTVRHLGKIPENAITSAISRFGSKAVETAGSSELAAGAMRYGSRIGGTIGESVPAWAADGSRNATAFLGRTSEKVGELVGSRFRNLTAENMMRNAAAGYVGGGVYAATHAALSREKFDFAEGSGTALGWAASNAVLGGKVGLRPGETRTELKAAETKIEPVEPVGEKIKPIVDVVPPKPTFKPETEILPNGDQQWTYRNVPNKGDTTTYTRNESPLLDWQIKPADGKVFDRSTKGPWKVEYPDGSILEKNEHNYLSHSRPVNVEIGGKQVAVREVSQLEPDQKLIAKQWVYEDPAVPNQKVTFNADRTWEAVGADGKSFNYRSEGPWKVTNLDGYMETAPAGSREADVQLLGASTWRDFVVAAKGQDTAGSGKPRAFRMDAPDMSPMSLSELPRTMSLSPQEII